MDGSRFRHDRTLPSAAPLSRPQVVAMLAGLATVVAVITMAAVLVKPNSARAFDLVRGTLFLQDARAPVAIDLANGRPTVRLVDARTQVDARSESEVAVVALTDTTLLLNRSTGAFNMVDSTGFVIKTTPGGVALPAVTGPTVATAVAAGERAYVIRTATDQTSVYLVAKATVESAVSRTAAVKPRASASLDRPSDLVPGSAVSADGALWLLEGTGGKHTIRQLSLPADSATGATLTSTARGTVTGLAALATTGPDRSGVSTVAVASRTQIQVFAKKAAQTQTAQTQAAQTQAAQTQTAQNQTAQTQAVPGLRDVDRILPVTNAAARLAFLYHSRDGWSLVTAGDAARVTKLDKIPATAALAAPVQSGADVYTMDTGAQGTLWQIGMDGSARNPAAAGRYPISTGTSGRGLEVRNFADAQLVAKKDRVIFNSPDHLLALTLFTDGSREPVTIDKSAAVDLNSVGGATALTKSRTQKAKTAPNPAAPNPAAPKPVTLRQQINDKATCAATTQTPHIPTITTATAASRSVLLAWTYPLLDNQDCAPSTYAVRVKLLSADAPSGPGQVTVQGQQGVNLTGLYPNTHYELTVTAFINGKGTPSAPVQVTTGREGPKAPTAVSTKVDATGTWTTSWQSCANVKTGCVPAANWLVVAKFCDGRGLAAAPAPVTVTGDETLTHFSAIFGGGAHLLGRGLSFSVQGVGALGDAGVATGDNACTTSWAPPAAAQITLTASAPGQTSLGATTSTTFTLNLGTDPTVAAGGAGAQFTYQLLDGPAVVASHGPTTQTSTTFTGITAGTTYSGRAIVSPPGHPEAAITVVARSISTRSSWPDLTIKSATVTRSSNPATGVLTVSVAGISSASAHGELFDLADAAFTCGSTSMPLTVVGIDPAAKNITADVDLTQYYGSCSVKLQLTESPSRITNPPLFGGTASPAVTATVEMPASPSASLAATDFTASGTAPRTQPNAPW